MINDITIGQYFPGNSVVHKMDARMKIVLTMLIIVALFVCKNFISLLAVTLAVKGMLPKNSIGAKSLTRLKVYAGSEHNNAAQKPIVLE